MLFAAEMYFNVRSRGIDVRIETGAFPFTRDETSLIFFHAPNRESVTGNALISILGTSTADLIAGIVRVLEA